MRALHLATNARIKFDSIDNSVKAQLIRAFVANFEKAQLYNKI